MILTIERFTFYNHDESYGELRYYYYEGLCLKKGKKYANFQRLRNCLALRARSCYSPIRHKPSCKVRNLEPGYQEYMTDETKAKPLF